MRTLLPLFLLLVILSCNSPAKKQVLVKSEVKKANVVSPIKVVILPLGNVPEGLCMKTYSELKGIFKNTTLMNVEPFPAFAYYQPRNRYRADKLIHWMHDRAKPGEVYLGITSQDISDTKGQIYDWGIMGLGYEPGNACIVSTCRLKDKANAYKVILHELGHTAGLPHCPIKTCYMRDAEGGDSTGDETDFCSNCLKTLRQNGWNL
jgi:archaemetzincin